MTKNHLLHFMFLSVYFNHNRQVARQQFWHSVSSCLVQMPCTRGRIIFQTLQHMMQELFQETQPTYLFFFLLLLPQGPHYVFVCYARGCTTYAQDQRKTALVKLIKSICPNLSFFLRAIQAITGLIMHAYH